MKLFSRKELTSPFNSFTRACRNALFVNRGRYTGKSLAQLAWRESDEERIIDILCEYLPKASKEAKS